MKDVLEYQIDELNEMSTDKLKELLSESESLRTQYNVRQLTEKTLINGLYGTLGNGYFSMYNEDMACAITGNGRYFIRKLANYIEDALQKIYPSEKSYIVYGDTDSVYYQIENLMKGSEHLPMNEQVNFANRIEEQIIQPIVQQCISDFSKELNAYDPSVIGAEREIISDTGILVAKKKYFARVLDDEGVRYTIDNPKMKVMGLELIKSSTSKFAKKHLKNSLNIMLDSNRSEMLDWIETIKSKYRNEPLASISSIAGISSLDYKLGDKGLPIGVRSALVHNKYIEDNNLTEQFSLISPGDKTKRLYLIEPNPLNSNIVSYLDDRFIDIFKEYIDYDTNFQKGFLKPLEIMMTALDWSTSVASVLDEW